MGFFSEDTLTYTKFRSLSLAEAQMWDRAQALEMEATQAQGP